MVHTWLKRVANFCSTCPFCWGVPGAVYLKLIPGPSCLQALSKAWFSLTLSQWRHCTCELNLVFKLLPNVVWAKSDFSHRKKLQQLLLQSLMTSSQWCFRPKVGVDGEQISKKSLSPKTCEQGTAFLLTAHCLALPKVQSSHGLNVLVTWILRALAVDLVMASDGWPNSMWKLLMFCLPYRGQKLIESQLQWPNHCKSWFSDPLSYCHFEYWWQCC